MKIIISWRLLPSSLENNYIIFHCSICEKLRKASKKVNIKGAKKLWAILKNTMYSCGFKNIDNNVADITWDKRIILVDITSVLRFCHSFLFFKKKKVLHSTFTKICMRRISALGFVFEIMKREKNSFTYSHRS